MVLQHRNIVVQQGTLGLTAENRPCNGNDQSVIHTTVLKADERACIVPIDLERVGVARMINVVTERRHQQPQYLN